MEEAKDHINVLELQAATLAIKALLPPQLLGPKHVHLRTDNTTAVVYINKRGGGHAPLFLQELWTMALDPGVSLTAQHIPGIQNTVAETASTQIETGKEEGFIYQNGSLCIPRKLSSAPVHYEIPGPRSTSCGRLSPGMKQVDLSNPSSGRPSPSDLEKDQSRPDNCSLNSSELRQTFIVPGASPDASGSTSADFPAPITVLSLTFQPAAQHPLWRSLHLALWPLSGSITKQQAFK